MVCLYFQILIYIFYLKESKQKRIYLVFERPETGCVSELFSFSKLRTSNRISALTDVLIFPRRTVKDSYFISGQWKIVMWLWADVTTRICTVKPPQGADWSAAATVWDFMSFRSPFYLFILTLLHTKRWQTWTCCFEKQNVTLRQRSHINKWGWIQRSLSLICQWIMSLWPFGSMVCLSIDFWPSKITISIISSCKRIF